ncbi:protein tyrosine phosphatase [Chromohalobacter marismortui]|uniref:protein-tyrosine-phosphatase n=1 Tax=Chromohalobacter marismortui TaxID=42055 RepID=A0A4R7NWZ0_9GAMM|nr:MULTISPECIES: low molecular weight protein-tyrosine-phosphatase [Chromohalobacter]MCI0510384.1 low molecular weight phosphotyrosine protein phosphatase [Chromohalobacter sp.]MCI0594731.1 low molecular weight phosphotyrosine protein phosphatase [Chromohalobacter sp.]TDU25040.1 protein tyrosine phosphatase [Chromohalobacter marismortui]
MTRILFVCLGNICRSPTAEGIVRARLHAAGLAEAVALDSCGTGRWHVGEPPDPRAQQEARVRGIDIASLRARQLRVDDFRAYDYLLAMDADNLAHMRRMAPTDCQAHLGLLLDFAGQSGRSVPDPYYATEDGFAEVFALIEQAADGLIEHCRQHLATQRAERGDAAR